MALDLFPIVLVSLLVLHVLLVVWLLRTKRLEKWDLSLLLGIVVMQRTQRGKRFIDWVSRPKRFWNLVGDFGIVLTLFGMVAITLFFLYAATRALQPASGIPTLGLQEIFVIPGVNPFVPLWYGLIALAITLIVHEGGHGVLARANGMKLKSLGLLWLVVPIGAFVEPEELDLKVARRRARLRVFGAGPAVNVAFAALSLLCLAVMAGSLEPKSGAWISGVTQDAGGADLPAKAAGLTGGDIVTKVDGETVRDGDGLRHILNRTQPGQTLSLTLGTGEVVPVQLTSAWATLSVEQQADVTAASKTGQEICDRYFDDKVAGETCVQRLQAKAVMGASFAREDLVDFVAQPLGRGGANLAVLASLPLLEVLGNQPILNVYLPSFYETPFHEGTFWVLANLAFWIFWINLMVGVTNILPMLPLDGGHIFREAVGGSMATLRPGMAVERREKAVATAATVMSLIILTAFILQIAGPYLVN